jgi:hypothetical protein
MTRILIAIFSVFSFIRPLSAQVLVGDGAPDANQAMSAPFYDRIGQDFYLPHNLDVGATVDNSCNLTLPSGNISVCASQLKVTDLSGNTLKIVAGLPVTADNQDGGTLELDGGPSIGSGTSVVTFGAADGMLSGSTTNYPQLIAGFLGQSETGAFMRGLYFLSGGIGNLNSTISLSSGDNGTIDDLVGTSGSNFYYEVTMPAAASLSGLCLWGDKPQIFQPFVTLHNISGFPFTIKNGNGICNITTLTGADRVISGRGTVGLAYSQSQGDWEEISCNGCN